MNHSIKKSFEGIEDYLWNIEEQGGDTTDASKSLEDIKDYIKKLEEEIEELKKHNESEKQKWQEKLIKKIKKMKKDEFSESGQIEMPEGYHPDYVPDVVYCANHTICRKYNQAIDDIDEMLNLLTKK